MQRKTWYSILGVDVMPLSLKNLLLRMLSLWRDRRLQSRLSLLAKEGFIKEHPCLKWQKFRHLKEVICILIWSLFALRMFAQWMITSYHTTALRSVTISSEVPPQIREQMLVPDILWYEKSIQGGLGSRALLVKKSLGPIMSNFWGRSSYVFEGKKRIFENIIASALKSCKEKR